MRAIAAIVVLVLAAGTAAAAPVHTQTGNLLTNGSLESGSTSPVIGHSVPSAADNWSQWRNSTGSLPATQLISASAMQSAYGYDIADGGYAVKVVASGAGDGMYTVAGSHTAWASAGTSQTYTFSGWVFVVSGAAALSVGSNASGYVGATAGTTGAWTFFSVTRSWSAGVSIDELLLYSSGGASTFIVDDVWLNAGATSTHPNQTVAPSAAVPSPRAGAVLKATYTPSYINANATFTTPGTLAGDASYIEFTQASGTQRLFSLPLVAAGTLSDSVNYAVTIVVRADAVTPENDLGVAVSDGTDMVGSFRLDSMNANVGYVIEAADTTPVTPNALSLGPDAATTATEWTTTVMLAAATSAYAVTNADPTSFGATAGRVVDRTSALRLTVFGDDPGEQYRILRIDVAIEDQVRLWVGGSDTSWATDANWSPVGQPSSGDHVRFLPGSGACVVNAACAARSVELPAGFTGTVSVAAPLIIPESVTVTSGTLEVGAGPLTVAGNVAVNGGTLRGAISGSGGPVTLTAGGTLKGNVAVGRSVVVGAGGRISPGN